MKTFTNKKVVQKVIIAILIVLSFNFIAPTYSRASVGGVLFGPIIDLFAKVGDAVLASLQYFMYDGLPNTGGTIGGTVGEIVTGDEENAGEIVGGAIDGAVTFINPFATFLVDVEDFDASKYGMEPKNEEVDSKIDENELDQGWFGLGTYQIPIIKYTPDKIFSNKIPALDVNFINPKDWSTGDEKNNGAAMNEKSVTIALHSIIANWYVALRNLAIVALLSVLLYVGIRMVISSTASDKAKYKQMIFDWLIALCILFFLHYIMSFVLTVTEMITEGVDTANDIVVQIDREGGKELKFTTDLTGLTRLQLQYKDLGVRMIYLIFYIALVVYTVMFTWTYVKRAITMAFLTLMAPLVAITYPIDKIGDGKAQAFGIWLKEFIFNALLQPFHLIIYTIFLGSATQIAVQNPIYAILFLAFIIPAEKLLRKMFGFEKSSTAGAMGAAAGMFGGAAAFKALSGFIGKGKGSSGSGKAGQGKIRTNKPVKDKNEIGKDLSAFAGSSNSSIAQRSLQQGLSDEENQEMNSLREELGNADHNDMFLNPSIYQAKQDRLSELQARQEQPRISSQTAQMQRRMAQGANTSRQDQVNNETSRNIHTPSRLQAISNAYQNMPDGRLKSVLGVGGKTIRGVGNVGKQGAIYTGKKLKHRFASREGWKENARFAGRMAVRGASAATFGAVGLGMGIAGDDLEDVVKLGLAGATLGGTVVGGRLSDAGGKLMHSANMTFQEGYYGDKNAALMAQQHNEYYNNEENREFFGEEFEVKGKELDNIMHRAADINNQGITDNKAIKQTIKLENAIKAELNANEALDMSDEEKSKTAREQAITIAKIADNYNTEKLRTDDKYVQGVYKDFRNGLKRANPKISESNLKEQSEQMMKLLRKYKKID